MSKKPRRRYQVTQPENYFSKCRRPYDNSTKYITLIDGHTTKVDGEYYDRLNQEKWFRVWCEEKQTYYVARWLDEATGEIALMHEEIMRWLHEDGWR